MSNNVIVHFNVKENKLPDFMEVMESVKNDLPKVEGCISVDIFRNVDNTNRFTLVETWDTVQQHQNNIRKLQEDGSWDFISGLLAKEPESAYFEQL
ncbi:putative quinol monooxygenase [Kangiella shandongensis]|uniref:putative quinol monooxygenase n=1 Tax=Kangiella shandongensis TaxID=2763258 RepID=UPI001CBADD22|nr:antibiotic biosynthesis monooxygenase family protein [Kangiella shandongensis]